MNLPLREIRRALQLSQEQMAALLHMSRRTYGIYERGARPPGKRLKRELNALLKLPDPGREDDSPLLLVPETPEEEELLHMYRHLDSTGRQYIFQAMVCEQSLTDLYRERRSPLGT